MNQIYNLISFVALTLTVVIIAYVIYAFVAIDPTEEVVQLPTAVILPTSTPITPSATFTPSRTPLPPTFTPTPTDTPTPVDTDTPTATITPSPTITDTPAATLTPSITFTPSVSATFTPSITPTGPTPTFTPSAIPFPFRLREDPTFTTNFANTAGCAWQGVGGQVLKFDGSSYTGSQLVVKAFSPNLAETERTANVGSNTLYGQTSGWEIALTSSINDNLYYVQLETINGTQVSPTIQIRFPQDCNQNVALLNFIETRPQP